MRFVERDRIMPPSIFGSDDARENRRRVLEVFMSGPLKRAQTRVSRTFSVADSEEVSQALSELFVSCCAFCESTDDKLSVYRFRPAEGASPTRNPDSAHLYYAWLAEAWQNLYPICSSCIPENAFYFPVAQGRRTAAPTPKELHDYVERDDGRWPSFPPDENQILLDPCFDRKLWRHLRFLGNGRVVPHGDNRRGRETIKQFRLDRADLTLKRRSVFLENYGNLRVSIEEIQQHGEPRVSWESSRYAGAWFLHLREMLGAALSRSPSEDILGQIKLLVRRDDWKTRLDTVVEKSREETDLYAPPVYLRRETMPAHELKAITIRNFKSLENIRIQIPPPPEGSDRRAAALLILGENSAGKSTLLEAIAITLIDDKVRALLNLAAGGLVLDPRYMGVTGGIAPKSASIHIEYAGSPSQSLEIAHTSDASATRHIARDFRTDGPANALPLFAYSAFRQFLETRRLYSSHKHVRNLFEPEQLLSNPEKWLLSLTQTRFNEVARALREVFSIEGDFEVLRRIDGVVYVVARLEPVHTDVEQHTPLAVVSSGFRSVLAMLCDIMQGLMDKRVNPSFQSLETARALVLIDEVEAHLHPRWKMAIMTGLRRALPQVMFIATSHDPLCLRGMGAGEVRVLERISGREAETELPVFTQSLDNLPDNRNWTIEQLLTADFFQLRTTANLDAERRLARIQDKLANGATARDDAEVRGYLEEVTTSLPIGDTDVHRLVQDAIQIYLADRRDKTRERLEALRETTRQSIVQILRGVS